MTRPHFLSRAMAAGVLATALFANASAMPQTPTYVGRNYAFVVHYDGSRINLGEVLLTSVLDGMLESPREFGTAKIVDIGDQPTGAYAGVLYVELRDGATSEAGERIATGLLMSLQDRLEELLVSVPRRERERRVQDLAERIDRIAAEEREVRAAAFATEAVSAPNSKWQELTMKLQQLERDRNNVEVKTGTQRRQFEVLIKSVADMDAQSSKRADEIRDLTGQLMSITPSNPEHGKFAARLEMLEAEHNRAAARLELLLQEVAELERQLRHAELERAQVDQRLHALRKERESTPEQITVERSVKVPEMISAAATLERQKEALEAELAGAEQQLRSVIRPRVVPWF